MYIHLWAHYILVAPLVVVVVDMEIFLVIFLY